MRHVIDLPNKEGLEQWRVVAITLGSTRRISRMSTIPAT